jgi:uncharacterized repeat protein (TIGR01451 family)
MRLSCPVRARARELFTLLLVAAATVLVPTAGWADPPPQYDVEWQSPTSIVGLEQAYHGSNAAQRFQTYFTDQGIRVIPVDAGKPQWEWGLSLSRYGWVDGTEPVPAATHTVSGNRIDFLRPGNIEEWYVNDPTALDQGLSLRASPSQGVAEGTTRLVLEYTVTGGLTAKHLEDIGAIEFYRTDGEPILRYKNIESTDADGREVPATLALVTSESGTTIRVTLETAEARFPIGVSAVTVGLDGQFGAEATSALVPPTNDLCGGAEVLPGAGPFPLLSAITGDITDATTTGDPGIPSCQTNISRSIWYTFTPATTGAYTISSCADAPTSSTLDDPVLSVWTSTGGCGGPFTQVAGGCDDDTCTSEALQAVISNLTLNAGTTYFILAHKFDTPAPTAGNTAVQLRISVPAGPPVNDLCGGAETIPGAGPFPYLTALTGDVSTATTTGDPGIPSCQTSVSRSIWYSFTPAATANYTISSCADAPTGSTLDDSVISVWTSGAGCAGPFTQLVGGCDDDSCASETLQAVLSANLTGGQQYWVLVHKFSTTAPSAGNTAIQLRVTQNVPPANDSCAGAVALSLDTPVIGIINGVTTNDFALSGAACFAGLTQTASTVPGRDVVYSFTAPSAGSYSFRVNGYSSAANVVLYTASSCPAGAPPQTVTTCLGASNRTTTGPAEEVMCQSLAAGQQVFAFVDENALTAGSTFNIEVNRCNRETEPNGTPATANVLFCGEEGSITPAADADFFRLAGLPGSGSRVFAMVDGISGNSNDFDMRVTTSTDTLEYDDFNMDIPFGSLAPNASGTPLTGVASFIRMNHFTASVQHEPYRLYTAVQPPIATATAEVEPNDTTAAASSGANNYFSGAFSGTADVDVFAFTANAGDLIVLGLDADPLHNNTPVNPTLGLLDAGGALLINALDGTSTSSTTPGTGSLTATTPNSPGEAIAWRARYTGTYYARVSLAGTTVGDYLLSISANCKIGPAADLSVTKTDSPDPVFTGGILTYTITVTNGSAGTARNVVLVDALPGFVGSAITSQGSCASGSTVTCNLGDIAGGGVATVTITGTPTVASGCAATTNNTASASSDSADPNGANNSGSASTTVLDPAGDADGDGTADGIDNCLCLFNDQTDTDGDTQGDACDADDDGDGVLDGADNCPLVSNPGQENNDADAQGDACDPDDDNDGVVDGADNCPFVGNADQTNTDGDAEGDACDADDDNDGVADGADNCPLVANPGQENNDGDAEGDACDADDDNDGVEDGADNCPFVGNADQTNTDGDAQGDACDADDDNDGVPDTADCEPLSGNNCEDNNLCTSDSCDLGTLLCVNAPNTNPCNDGNACGGGTCNPGGPTNCSDGNVCTDDACNTTTGCFWTNNSDSCDDGIPCTAGDTCNGGVCAGVQQGARPRTKGYYRSLCNHPHSGDELTAADAACVSALSTTFVNVTSVADICTELGPNPPNNDSCNKSEMDLMALALNICKGKVCATSGLDPVCGSASTVGEAFETADAILANPGRTTATCNEADCATQGINNGHLLALDNLTMAVVAGQVRLDWEPPLTETPVRRYFVWRRVAGSLAPFTLVGSTSTPHFADATGMSGNFEYEIQVAE